MSFFSSKKGQKKRADEKMEPSHNQHLEAETTESGSDSDREATLVSEIGDERAVFLCIQTQSKAKWGLLLRIMACLGRQGVDIIDHRCWHPRGINSTLMNEIYCRDKISGAKERTSQKILEGRMEEIRQALENTINQPEAAKVKVQRWYPGVVQEIIEEIEEKRTVKKRLNLDQRLLQEASSELDRKQNMMSSVTKEKTVDEILADSDGAVLPSLEEGQATLPRRRRFKVRSTPVLGGSLFGETDAQKADLESGQPGRAAELVVGGETFDVRVSDATLEALRKGFTGVRLDAHGVSVSGLAVQPSSSSDVNQLRGYVRSGET